MHQSVCAVSVFVPWAVIVTNPGSSLPLLHSLSLGHRRMVSDKPVLWHRGWTADRCAALQSLKCRFCFAPIWSVRLLLPAKAQTCHPSARTGMGSGCFPRLRPQEGIPQSPLSP